jgi:hypothetical protein
MGGGGGVRMMLYACLGFLMEGRKASFCLKAFFIVIPA